MSAITNVLRQLVQRRLWPVAILLVAALAAVPFALAKEPEPVDQPSAPVALDDDNVLATEPIVAKAPVGAERSRKVLGERKNPFGFTANDNGSDEAPDSQVTARAQDPAKTQDPAPTPSVDPPVVTPGGGTTIPPTVVPDPPVKPRKFDVHELTVRFGASSGDLVRSHVKRLEPLPDAENPVLMYLGVLKDGKTAVFLVEKDVDAVGDGTCLPTPEQCETLRLRAGETEFLDVLGEDGEVAEQYQLDLLKIHKGETANVAKASSKAGRRLLAERDGALPYRYDAATGTLERRSGALGRVVATTAARLP